MDKTIIAVRHYPDKKKPCLVIEHGNQALVIATFRNESMVNVLRKLIGENKCLEIDDSRTIDELLEGEENG